MGSRRIGIFEGSKPSVIEEKINYFLRGGYSLISADVKFILTASADFWYVATIVYTPVEG